MQLNFYSCLMAMIASTTMIIVIYFLKKTKYFSNAFGVLFMAMLYIFSFIRILFPIEISAVQVIMGDKVLLPKIMDVLENRSYLTADLPCKALYIFGSASLLVTITLLLVLIVRQLAFVLEIVRTKNYATNEEQKMLSSISREVFGRRTMMKLLKSDEVSVPMVVGVLKSTVVIPNREYSEGELELILYHECTHLKNHDLWLKLLIHIYCCVYWFNPFVYLLKSDVDFILEIKCDNAVCRHLDEKKKLDYAKLVNDNARLCQKKRERAYLMTSNFASTGTSRHICRMNSLLNPTLKSPKIPTLIVSLLMIAICMLSYVFVWQPDYSNNAQSIAAVSITSDGNLDEAESFGAYLVPAENGDYIFYYGDEKSDVLKGDVEKGYYDNCPIVDAKKTAQDDFAEN